MVIARARLEREIARAQGQIDKYAQRAAAGATQGRRPKGQRPLASVEDYSYVKRARAALDAALEKAQRPPAPAPAGQGKVRYRNITDPDARSMPTRKGWVTGYNNQLAVSADQLIVALSVEQNPADNLAFVPMLEKVEQAADLMARCGSPHAEIGIVLADAGYRSEANITAPGPDRLIATGKHRTDLRRARQEPASGRPPAQASALEAMDHRLRTPEGQEAYRHRGHLVEGTNGQLKDVIGLRRFARRGLRAAISELHFAAAVHNVLKLFRAQGAIA
ncbi:transposase [Georgenia satyanarayanai]|uniref:transposase n=1 Tax=Georgenia satyanarayanai TaxID=860221 RepID=UPI00203AC258|nr:transposase [Georgenia satyanarayanai]MCM3659730.1 transposase [Georgenia satyanarayanai]